MILQKGISEKLSGIKRISTECFNSAGKLTYCFNGSVKTEIISENEIVFNEYVKWENENSLLINSKNIYRWTILDSGNVKLEHLRFGKNNPVFLVELFPDGENNWKSIQPHTCINDLYSAELNLKNENLVLIWTVKGPTENYSMETVYLNH